MPKGICNNTGRTWFKKGHIPWIQGKKMSKEFCEKLSLANIGIQAKEKHPRWKGGFPKCIDCKNPVTSRYAIRCKKCNGKFQIGVNSPRFNGGKPKCINCGKRLKSYIGKRCKSCSRKGALNHLWKDGISKQEKYSTLMSRQRRARENNAEGSHTLQEWELLKKQYGFKCPSCHRKEPEIILTEDHIIPLIKGGSHYIENIQPLCINCNSKKHTKILTFTIG